MQLFLELFFNSSSISFDLMDTFEMSISSDPSLTILQYFCFGIFFSLSLHLVWGIYIHCLPLLAHPRLFTSACPPLPLSPSL